MAYVDPAVACEPWTDATKLCETGSGDSVDCDGTTTPLSFKWTVDQVIAAATNLLFQRTCFRYPGICTRTVIPCICGTDAHCVCGNLEPTIELTSEYPIHDVTEIRFVVEGQPDDILPPTSYRLDENSRIVRTDGERWPVCFTDIRVTYTTGRTPPIELEMAAAELADELLKACNGGECKLPAHVRSVQRRGIETEVWDVVALMASGLTGLPMVDHALSVHGGPCRRSKMFDATRSRVETRVS